MLRKNKKVGNFKHVKFWFFAAQVMKQWSVSNRKGLFVVSSHFLNYVWMP